MANFYQLGGSDNIIINLDLVSVIEIVDSPDEGECYSLKVCFSGGHYVSYGDYSKEDAEQELSNFLAHCEGQFED